MIRNGFGNQKKQYAGKENVMVQLGRKLIASFILTIGTLTPLLLFFFATWASFWKDSAVCSKNTHKVFSKFHTTLRGCLMTRR